MKTPIKDSGDATSNINFMKSMQNRQLQLYIAHAMTVFYSYSQCLIHTVTITKRI